MNIISRNIIFIQGSVKYFFATLLVPPRHRKNIATLYNFSRYLDDKMDVEHVSKEDFKYIYKVTNEAINNRSKTGNDIIDEFVDLVDKKEIPTEWVDSLFRGIESDSEPKKFYKLEDTLDYTYCVAEVIGLMVCKIVGISEEAYDAARYTGRAGQWANFLRDAYEDYQVGRVYFPLDEFNGDFKLPIGDQQMYESIHKQIERYREYRALSREGYKYIPWYLRFAVGFAGRYDDFVVNNVEKDPRISFNKNYSFWGNII